MNCCPIDKVLLQVQYINKPDGNCANMNSKNSGINFIINACVGSAGCGFDICCKNIVRDIAIGSTPIIKNSGGSQGIIPKRLKIVVESGAERS